ncbi:hypothetical protein [Staphylococcus simulans]|uniref:hypothetical protein n=1 Tax=Staphylococcus simulans TaxID=1286 RepID=UPI003F82258E
MKYRTLAATLASATLILAACGNQEENKQSKNEDTKQSQSDNNEQTKKESNTTDSKTQSNDHSTSKKDNHQKKPVKDVAQLQTNEKVALALFAPQKHHNAVTANELLNHSYTMSRMGSPSEEQIAIDTYHLEKIPAEFTGAPQDMVFYHAKESTGHFVTIIGVSDYQVLVSGTQGERRYQEIVDNGDLHDLNELNQKYGNESQLQQVANMISINDAAQGASSSNQAQTESSNDSTSSDSSSDSDSGETVTRDNVIDKVEEYEGHTLDTSTYTYKEPEQMGDGRWGFSILDKSGELAGSYIVNSDGSVEKYDADGERE